MGHNGSGVYSLPDGVTATTLTEISSADYNAFLADIASAQNYARVIANGGTGATSASAARGNLGLAIGTDVQAQNANLSSLSSLTLAANKGLYATAADTVALFDLTAAGLALLDDADAAAQRTTLGLGALATQSIVSNGPAVITAAGAANYSFTGIPAGVNEFKLSMDGVSLSGTNDLMIRLGPSAGLATTGYVCSTSVPGASAQATGGFIMYLRNAAIAVSGVLTFVRFEGTNKWSVSCGFVRGADAGVTAGSVTLSGELSQVQILASSSDNVDAGQIGLRYII